MLKPGDKGVGGAKIASLTASDGAKVTAPRQRIGIRERAHIERSNRNSISAQMCGTEVVPASPLLVIANTMSPTKRLNDSFSTNCL